MARRRSVAYGRVRSNADLIRRLNADDGAPPPLAADPSHTRRRARARVAEFRFQFVPFLAKIVANLSSVNESAP
jgi:hypothetical protein